MAGTAVTAEHLSKRYIIGHQGRQRGQYVALRDVITDAVSTAGKRLLHAVKLRRQPVESSRTEEFWALKDVSFEINQGDRVGIIGRNGAGKSTLLKILSRITEPTRGRLTITGRVASLLEVGTGFHPELTGRENIFLNGAILGMTRQEIKSRFDAIVDFAEIEQFLDTPVKRYSSGMYVRLAFAVAAHLEPEVLIVDEVLAVGDVQFQKKCVGRMEKVGAEGRTILFVSHNMTAVQQLCNSAFLFDKGQILHKSRNVSDVIKSYLQQFGTEAGSSEWTNRRGEFDNPFFVPQRFALTDAAGRTLFMPVRNDDEVWVHVEGDVREPDERLAVSYFIYNDENVLLYQSASHDVNGKKCMPGHNVLRTRIPGRLLNEGKYRLDLVIFLHGKQFITQSMASAPAIALEIQGGLSDSPTWLYRRPGVIAPALEWDLRVLQDAPVATQG